MRYSGPDGLQSTPGEPQRFVAIAAGLRRAGPAIEHDPEHLRRALLGELARLLERPARRRAVAFHAELADQHEETDLRVRVVDLAGELQRFRRLVERRLRVGPREDLGLRRADRGERRLSLGF